MRLEDLSLQMFKFSFVCGSMSHLYKGPFMYDVRIFLATFEPLPVNKYHILLDQGHITVKTRGRPTKVPKLPFYHIFLLSCCFLGLT